MSKKKFYVKLYTDLATELDLESAVILMRIVDWCNVHSEGGYHKFFKDGKWWCWNSVQDLCEQLPYLKYQTTRRRLDVLVKNGWVYRGNFNRSKQDRTYWYSPNWDKLRPYMPEEVKAEYADKLSDREEETRNLEEGALAEHYRDSNHVNTYYDGNSQSGTLQHSKLEHSKLESSTAHFGTFNCPNCHVEHSTESAPLPEITSETTSETDTNNLCPDASDETSPLSSQAGSDKPTGKEITLYEGHPSLSKKIPQEEQKDTALVLSSKPNTDTPPKKQRKPKERLATWEETDEFSSVFSLINRVPTCKMRFDREDYRQYLRELMTEHNFTVAELAALAKEWSEYQADLAPGQKCKSPKNSFRTWCRNNAKWRKNGGFTDRKREKFEEYKRMGAGDGYKAGW